MKRCPTCNQMYADEAAPFCSLDGSQLIEMANAPAPPNSLQATMAYQAPPAAAPRSFGAPSIARRTKLLALTALILGCVATPFLLYLFFRELLMDYTFRTWPLPRIIFSMYGGEFFLGVLLTLLSVALGINALAMSIKNPTRYGGRAAAIIGPVLCVASLILAVGLFSVRRAQGRPNYAPIEINTSPSNSNSSPNRNSSSSTMTDEEKYRLFYAATKTEDKFLQSEAAKKIGIIDADGRPTSYYQTFIKGSVSWAMTDTTFIRSVDTPAKARAYVNSHMDY